MNTKRILSLILTVLLVLIALSAFALVSAAEGSGDCGENLTWTLDDNGTLSITGTGAMYDYKYHAGDNPVPWWSRHEDIKAVVIGNDVTSIGQWAFDRCSNLASVTIGSGVTTIGNFAFQYCSSLTELTIPSSVTTIEVSAFAGSGLTSVVIGNSVESIGINAFYGCTSLTSVTIPDNVTSIANQVFYNCSGLTSVSIGSGVTSIGDSAFYNCTSLTSVTIPDKVTSIGNSAFYNCTSLTNVTIPDNVTSIGRGAFRDCDGLTEVKYNGKTISTVVSPANSGTAAVTGITVSGTNETDRKLNVTLTATANSGYAFVKWTEGTTQVSTDATYTIASVAEDRTLTANFAPEGTVPVSYIDTDGTDKTAYCQLVTSDVDSLTSGWWAVTEDVTTERTLDIKGDVNLILCDGKSLMVRGQLFCEASLTLWGQSGGSGTIDTSDKVYIRSGAEFTMNGGTVTGSGTCSVGNENVFTMNGGTVENKNSTGTGVRNKGSFTMNGGDISGVAGVENKSSGTFILDGDTPKTITGEYKAIDGTVKNMVGGTGWTDTAGTGIGTNFDAASDGAQYNYNKIRFPAIPEGTVLVPYVDAAGNDMGEAACRLVTDSMTSLSSGWWAVQGEVDPEKTIDINGDVNLILCDGVTVTISALSIPEGKSLTLWCQSGKSGTISANADHYLVHNYGTFTMNGGTLSSQAKTVSNHSTFTMNDGTISGKIVGVNNANGSTFTMNGGTISSEITGVMSISSEFKVSGDALKTITGRNKAIDGTVMNLVPGTAWLDPFGTGDGTPIGISKDGQTLATRFKRVQFPAESSGKSFTVEDIEPQTYSGKGITPALTVKDAGTGSTLTAADYSVSYQKKDGEGWINADEIKNAGEYKAVVTGNNVYAGTTVEKPFTVAQKPLTITVKDQTYAYDGSPQGEDGTAYNDQAVIGNKVKVDGLADGDVLTGITLTGTATDVNVYPKAIKASGAWIGNDPDINGADNYVITYVPGTLTIEPAKVTLTAKSMTEPIPYDGTEKTVGGYTCSEEGLAFPDSVIASGKGTDAGKYQVKFEGVTVGETKDSTGNYVVDKIVPGSFEISRRPLDITVADKEVEYNGGAQAGSTECTFTGLVTGHTATIGYTPSSGTLPNTYGNGSFDAKSLAVVDANGKHYEKNYEIKNATKGKLIIADRSDPYAITVTANSTTAVYDGTEKSAEGFVTLEFTAEGKQYTVSGLTTSDPRSTNVCDLENTISGTAVVNDADGHDVTGQFTVTLEPGRLTITKATPEFTVTADPVTDNLSFTPDMLTRSGKDADVPGTIALDESELVYGTATYHWTFTPQDSKNYKPLSGTVEITVSDHVWKQPVWRWTPEHKASATFACTTCEESVTLEASVLPGKNGGVYTFTATVTFNGQTYSDVLTIVPVEETRPTPTMPFPMMPIIVTEPAVPPAEPEPTTTTPETPAAPTTPEPAQPTKSTAPAKEPLWKQFKDVDPEAWYLEYIEYMLENGLMSGTGADKFEPSAATTRAMIVTVLYRLEGEPKVTNGKVFDDVPVDSWFAKPVTWAKANGIVVGYNDGRFGPTDTVTREQLASLLELYAFYKKYDVDRSADLSKYADVKDVSDWTLPAIQWAVADGLLSGRTATTLAPKGEATRAEVAAILVRFAMKFMG